MGHVNAAGIQASAGTMAADGWVEVGDRVFVRRYALFDQNIVAVVGHGETLVVDTRSSHRQGDEILAHLRNLGAPPVAVIVNTHAHYDHVFGNRVFRPAVIWGHERCATKMRDTGDLQRVAVIAAKPELADELREVVLDPPDRTFNATAAVEVGGREVALRYLGRGHTDNDIVLVVPDADVVCAGDLLENNATPFFGDGYPLDWPLTVGALLGLLGDRTVVVPGHGDHAGRGFAESSLTAFRAIADLARRVHSAELSLDEAIDSAPYDRETAREPLERALAQLRGDLDE